MSHLVKQVVVLFMSVLLIGCGSLSTSIRHHDLKVQTKMSDSIFLMPVDADQRTVFLEVRNTTGNADFQIEPLLSNTLKKNGVTIVDKVEDARYILQVNVLKVEDVSPEQVSAALASGFGAVVGGAAANAISDGDAGATVAGAAVGGLASAVSSSLVKEVEYAVITDVQISERTTSAVEQNSQTHLKQGTATASKEASSETGHWKHYRTRIISTADQANLKFKDAKPLLENGIANAVAGLF